METGTKIGLGVVAAAAIGAAIYFGFIKKAKTTAGIGGAGSPPSGSTDADMVAPNGSSLAEKIAKAKKDALKIKCNLKTPPPRFKQAKKDEYKKCLLGADGYTWGR